MSFYYERSKNANIHIEIFNRDFRPLEDKYKDNWICVTDPPYNVGYHYNEYEDNLLEDDYLTMLSDIINFMPVVMIHSEASIIDPFGGSGTTAVACKELGRNCDIYELSKEYCDIISQRINAHNWQLELF